MHRAPLFLNRVEIPAGLQQSRSAPFFARATGRSFDVRAAADVAEIDLYEEIGYWGVTAADLRQTLRGITASEIVLRINSPGGDVFDGLAMYNELVDHRASVTVRIMGLAASAASIVAMAGDRVEMAKGSFFMIHNAWVRAIGDSRAMAEISAVLAQIDQSLNSIYADRTGRDAAEITAMMDAETWLNADSAVASGFADASVEIATDANAAFDLSVFNNLPRELAARRIGAPNSARDLERTMRESGYSKSQARAFAARALSGGRWDAGPDDSRCDAGLDADTREAFARTIQTLDSRG